MKILVVDDETVSRIKLTAILESFGDCRAVGSGPEAIAEVRQALAGRTPFDLITMDIAMPGMDGTEALLEIRTLEQAAGRTGKTRTRVIMITAQSDRDSLITCVQAGCDDYIIKPFDPEMVVQRLKALKLTGMETKAEGRDKKAPAGPLGYRETDKVAIGKEVLTLFRKGEISLPSPPAVYRRFRRLVEEGADLSQIAELLKEDIGVSFHLISISNSPVYRGVEENRNLLQAVSRLGLDLTRKYVDILGNRAVFTTSNQAYQPLMEYLWTHSVACANAAEILARALEIKTDHDPFTMGILHDVGKMVLIQVVSELESRGKIERNFNRADMLRTLAAYHGPFGEAVLRQWTFPEDFGRVARLHDELDAPGEVTDAVALIQLANLLSKSMGYGQAEPSGVNLVDSPPARRFNLTREKMEEAAQRLAAVMEETQKTLE
ncbi:MAG: HDOD domain-containing protein [Pseudomonadota bacterium]